MTTTTPDGQGGNKRWVLWVIGLCAAGMVLVVFVVPLLMMLIIGGGAQAGCGQPGAGVTVPGAGGWVQPMKKDTFQLTSPFGPRGGAMHQGQDFGSTPGQPIYAAHGGIVDKSGPATGFGQWIVIDFDGTDGTKASNVYGHMFPQDLMVKVGQQVTAGQQIAKVGYNGEVDPAGPGGAHLHFEHWVGGTREGGGHAVDPMPALNGAPDPGSSAAAAQQMAAGAAAPPVGGSADGSVVSADDWNKVAKLESGGNWAIDTGNGYQGGLQFSPSTWTGNRGNQYAATANKATPAQQMEVANRVLKSQGWGAWPATSKAAGVTGKKPAPEGAFTSSAPAPAAPSAPSAAPAPSATAELAAATAPNDQPLPPLPASKGSEAHFQVDTVRLARVISLKFPEVKTIGGWRADGGGYNDHPSGRAVDVMIDNYHDPKQIDLGNRIQKFVIDNKKALHVEYTIWRQRYTAATGETNIMEDRGSENENHFNHVHITLIGGGYPKPGQVYTFNGVLPGAAAAPQCDATATAVIGGAALKPGVVPGIWVAPLMKASTVCREFTAPVLAAQAFQETGGSYRTDLESPAGAIGPTQFLPATWTAAGMDGNGDGIKDPRNVEDAVWSMAHYDCAQLDMAKTGLADGSLKGDPVQLALSGYNCGPGGTQSFGGVCPYTETQNYVTQITERATTFAAAS